MLLCLGISPLKRDLGMCPEEHYKIKSLHIIKPAGFNNLSIINDDKMMIYKSYHHKFHYFKCLIVCNAKCNEL